MKPTSTLFLNKNEQIHKTHGSLPHWFQDGKLQFVTFRLADSIPVVKAIEIKNGRKAFEKQYPRPWDEEVLKRYQMLYGRIEDELLDAGYGSCVLKKPEIRKIVIDSFNFVDGNRCEVWAYVIMPNHIHIILLPLEENTLEGIIGSVKGFTGREINKYLGRAGELWQRESFDRIVRNRDSLLRYVEYIKENPRNLAEGEYELYINYSLIYG